MVEKRLTTCPAEKLDLPYRADYALREPVQRPGRIMTVCPHCDADLDVTAYVNYGKEHA